MARVLMSIKPAYVKEILNGNKRFEFRKTLCKRKVSSLLIYATAPIKKVVAEIQVSAVLNDTPSEIWKKTSYAAGISKEQFDKYFCNCSVAVAYSLGEIKQYNTPLPLDYFGIRYAPQSYCYLPDTDAYK